jgi:hypothetical protein
MKALPDPWREEMVQEFREYRDVTPETELITIFGGIYSWEREPDPAVRERMRRPRPGS